MLVMLGLSRNAQKTSKEGPLLQAADIVLRSNISNAGGDVEGRDGRHRAGTVQAIQGGVEDLVGALLDGFGHGEGKVEVLALVGQRGAQVGRVDDLTDGAFVAGGNVDAEGDGDVVDGLDVDLVDHDGGEGVTRSNGRGNFDADEAGRGPEDGESGSKSSGGTHFDGVEASAAMNERVCDGGRLLQFGSTDDFIPAGSRYTVHEEIGNEPLKFLCCRTSSLLPMSAGLQYEELL